MTTLKSPIAILGAGSIGCYVGGMMHDAGCEVRFIGRENTGRQITRSGLILSALDRNPVSISSNKINWNTAPEAMAGCKAILLCTKSNDTLASAKLISKYCNQDSVIVSLQNGVGNGDILRKTLGDMTVLPAMVSFNIARIDGTPLRFHRGSDGEIIFQQHPFTRQLSQLLSSNGVRARCVNDMKPVAWGKLMMNLNNAVNVISGLPLKRQLQNRDWRLVFAASVKEAMEVLKHSSIKPAKIGGVSPALIPVILRLPDPVFNFVAGSILKIDENARSSMWEDLQAGRNSEIDYLNGAICDLGRKLNVPTPVNDLMIKLVKQRFDDNHCDTMPVGEILDKIRSGMVR